ncbi:MAG: translocation and assembly module lipoprotein TamL [Phocaeicola sp.]|uniref:translocation and assembly module lipoprotein TamL n=1 Tax=Phocaeicola TaxID=909656 RepID=UPI00234F83BE|nr:BamA/TamA family outer membrane protein [Phocaeicola oris]MCE2617529.1 BamA/TamA family outer membrane protein [Phocaeicola oris]
MRNRTVYIYKVVVFLMVLIFSGCSTTKNLLEGEMLYTGVKKMKIHNEDKSATGVQALEEVEAAISYPPNNAILSSNSLKFPIPFGLWIYNGFVKYQNEKGPGNWIFRKLASKPVYLSTVNADTRVKVATNLLRDYGFFNGSVTYKVDTVADRKAKLLYNIDFQKPYYFDTLMYVNYSARADSLIKAHEQEKLVHRGDHFNVLKLYDERTRVSNLFRNNGYFYYRPDYISFLADTIQRPGYVAVKLVNRKNLSKKVARKYYVGDTEFILLENNVSNQDGNRILRFDSVQVRNVKIKYIGDKPALRPSVIRRRYYMRKGNVFSQSRFQISQERIARLGIFKMTDYSVAPKDSTPDCDTLNIRVMAMLDQPYDVSLETNVATKSTDQAGPGAILSLTRNNFLRSAAALSFQLKGSYEWQTTSSKLNGENRNKLNSYEIGLTVGLEFPELILPWVKEKGNRYRYAQHTSFKLYGNQLKRSRYFTMLSFGGSVSYDFMTSRTWKHTITPFRLTFNTLQHTTEAFNAIMNENRTLQLSLSNQFIPALSYTFTYDNSKVNTKNHYWWETSFTSAGNATSVLFAVGGLGLKEKNKKMLNSVYAQFIKGTTEFRYLSNASGKSHLAARAMAGIIYSYGNTTVSPYSEQFYIGGANSVRAFTIRSIGPGTYHPDATNRYGYIDEVGDVKLEANLEYRFPILGNLNGATFLDAGNVWMLRNDESRQGGKLSLKDFGKSIALGTGFGLRYDMEFLVIRLDMGIGIHAPYDTGKRGYYNIPKFKDGIGLHLAIGYPF